MTEQMAVPIITIPPPREDLLKQAILKQAVIQEIEQKIHDLEREALAAIESRLLLLREDLEKARTEKESIIQRAVQDRVYEQDRYILVDKSRETRIPRVDLFRQGVPSDVLMQISETRILLGKADDLLGKNRVTMMCDIQRGSPSLDVTVRGKKHYQTTEGFWRS